MTGSISAHAVTSPYAPSVAPLPASVAPAPILGTTPGARPDTVVLGVPSPAEVSTPPHQSTPGHRVGAALLLALSLTGVAGCATMSLPIPSDPGSVSHPLPATADGTILNALQARNQLRESTDVADGDRYGRPVTAAKALEDLQTGQAVVVRTDMGEPHSFRQPFPISERDVARTVSYEGVRVSSLTELERLNAAEGYADVATPVSLAPQEKEVASMLRHFEGGVPGGFVRETFEGGGVYPTFPGGLPGPVVVVQPQPAWEFLPDQPVPAIYSQTWKGGFLGLGKHQDRISAYEGLAELQAGRALTIRAADGQAHEVHNVDELKALHQTPGM